MDEEKYLKENINDQIKECSDMELLYLIYNLLLIEDSL